MDHHNPDIASKSVAVVFGTRPEIIKLALIIRALGTTANLIHTGQHYDSTLSDSFLDAFDLGVPDAHLGVGGKSRAGQIASAVAALDDLFVEERPVCVVVQGDTNTTLAGAIAANANEIPIVHVEAGLRSRDRRMPEEHNRVMTDHLADLLCAPTDIARDNILAEGIAPERITVTGNTVVEAVQALMPSSRDRSELLQAHGLESGGFILSTFHRPENVDDPERFAVVIDQLSRMPLPVVLPIHPRSRHRAAEFGLEEELGSIRVIDPVGYPDFLGLGAESAFLVSDSGGVQEEVSVFKRPVVVVRRSTERPEVIGTFARLVEPGDIVDVVGEWLRDLDAVHRQLSDVPSPYGDGTASEKTVEAISQLLGRV